MFVCPEIGSARESGWRLLAWSGFAELFAALERETARLAAADPTGYAAHPRVKLFAAMRKLVEDVIPAHPNAPEFQPGNTLRPQHRHWRRARLGGRFRLFHRSHTASRAIVYAWMNDEGTLRKEGSRTDPYVVFRRTLEGRRPPSDRQDLIDEAGPMKLG